LLAGMLRRQLRSSLIATFGSNLVIGIAAGGLVVLNRRGVLSLAETAAVAAAMLLFAQQLLGCVSETNRFFESAPLVNDLNEFLGLRERLVGYRSGAPIRGAFGRIDLDDVTFRYRDTERDANEAVDLAINAGEV